MQFNIQINCNKRVQMNINSRSAWDLVQYPIKDRKLHFQTAYCMIYVLSVSKKLHLKINSILLQQIEVIDKIAMSKNIFSGYGTHKMDYNTYLHC